MTKGSAEIRPRFDGASTGIERLQSPPNEQKHAKNTTSDKVLQIHS